MAVQTPTLTTTADERPEQRPPRDGPPWTEKWGGLFFIAPFGILFAFFLLWPTFAGLWNSFFNTSLAGVKHEFLGLRNWRELFGDPAVWDSLKNTLIFTAMSTPPLVVIALLMALLANRKGLLGWLLRFSYFAPFVLPATVVTLIWVWIYQPGFGLVNGLLTAGGFAEIDWLNTENRAMLAVVITTVWWTVGFNFLLYLAALQGIPDQVYEAAAIDGAGAWRTFWKITFPLLKPGHFFVAVVSIIGALQQFDQSFIVGGTSGGPNYSTMTVVLYLYNRAFSAHFGYAAAVGLVLFVFIFTVTVIQRLLFGKAEVA